jgi:hypothetical protein
MESAIRCDCGYDFPSGQVTDSYLSSAEQMNTKYTKSKGIGRRLLSWILSILGGVFMFWGLFWIYSIYNGMQTVESPGVDYLGALVFSLPGLIIGLPLLVLGIRLLLREKGRISRRTWGWSSAAFGVLNVLIGMLFLEFNQQAWFVPVLFGGLGIVLGIWLTVYKETTDPAHPGALNKP